MSRIVKKLKIEDETTSADSGKNLKLLSSMQEEYRAVGTSPKPRRLKTTRSIATLLTITILSAGILYARNHGFGRAMVPSSAGSGSAGEASNLPPTLPNQDEVEHATALHLFRSKEYAKSLAKFEGLLSKHPNDASLLNNLGMNFLKLNDYKRAEAEFQKAIKLEPKDGATYNNLGTLMLAQNNFDDAIAYFYQAILYHPEMLEPHLNLAKAFELAGKPMEAIPEYQTYLDHAGAKNDPELKKLVESRILMLNTFAH